MEVLIIHLDREEEWNSEGAQEVDNKLHERVMDKDKFLG